MFPEVLGGFSGHSELCVPKAAGAAKQAPGVDADQGKHMVMERSREDAAAWV